MVVRFCAHSRVALHAADLRVQTKQWVARGGMVPHREARRLPTGLVVAGSTLAALTSRELSLMTVLVAIETQLVRDLGTEILRVVALLALHRPVFAFERKVGPRVVESALGNSRRFPSSRRMTLLAIAGEGSAVGILVARFAALEDDEVLVLHAARGRWEPLMALGAGHFLMKPRKRVRGLVMREALGVLPRILIVAASAVGSQIPPMLIGMATPAEWRQPQVRFTGIQVRFTETRRSQAGYVLRCHLGRVVTLLASNGCVLARQRPSSLTVVETVLGSPPAHEFVLPAVSSAWHLAQSAAACAPLPGRCAHGTPAFRQTASDLTHDNRGT